MTGTVARTDLSTGIVSTISYNDMLYDGGSGVSFKGDTLTQTASGTSTDVLTSTSSGTDTVIWTILETVTRKNASGNVLALSTKSDSGSDTDTLNNGVLTKNNPQNGNSGNNPAAVAAVAAVSAASPGTFTAAAVAAAVAVNGTPGPRSEPVGGYESPFWAGTYGFFHGVGTGGKAVINQSAKATGGLVSLGKWEPGDLIKVNPETDIGYDTSAAFARVGAETLIVAGTMGSANLGRVGQALNAIDTAGNIVQGVTGVVDVAQTGQLTVQNSLQIVTGGAAVLQVGKAASKMGHGMRGGAATKTVGSAATSTTSTASASTVGVVDSTGKYVPYKTNGGCAAGNTNCFVAGTRILVKSDSPAVVAFVVADNPDIEYSESGLSAVMMIGAGIAFAVAKSKMKEDETTVRLQPRMRPKGKRPDDDSRHDDPRLQDFYEVGSDETGQRMSGSGLSLQLPLLPMGKPTPKASQKWLTRALTAAMLVCFGVGGWYGAQSLKSDQSANAAVSARSATPEFVTKNIEDIQEGDLVLARDEHGSEIGWKPVEEVYRRKSFHLRHLTFRDATGNEQELQTTDEHPFFVADTNGFVDAGALQPGQEVLCPNDLRQRLVATRREEHPEGIKVFNFKVQGFHTYYAAGSIHDTPILVHNANKYDLPGDLPIAPNRIPKPGDPDFIGPLPPRSVPTPHKFSGKSVADILKSKKGSIKNADLPEGSPTWNQVTKMTWEEIEAAAKANTTGFKTIKKLLTDGRFNR